MTTLPQTPAMQQYHRMKAEHPGTLLFFRMGDFYELFFEDAVVAARALEIALTSRSKDREGEPIPMCGVPHHAVTAYVGRLVKQGFRVALCEQMEDPRLAKGVVKREVVRVITPGTQLESSALEAGEAAFVLAVAPGPSVLGAAWIDATTGEFEVAEWEVVVANSGVEGTHSGVNTALPETDDRAGAPGVRAAGETAHCLGVSAAGHRAGGERQCLFVSRGRHPCEKALSEARRFE